MKKIEAERPRIIKLGNDPECVHYEKISDGVGTCQRCGQVKSYKSSANAHWAEGFSLETKNRGEGLLPFRHKRSIG